MSNGCALYHCGLCAIAEVLFMGPCVLLLFKFICKTRWSAHCILYRHSYLACAWMMIAMEFACSGCYYPCAVSWCMVGWVLPVRGMARPCACCRYCAAALGRCAGWLYVVVQLLQEVHRCLHAVFGAL